jgi:hypothetical protein
VLQRPIAGPVLRRCFAWSLAVHVGGESLNLTKALLRK